jgi:ferredoxin-NADP reductase
MILATIQLVQHKTPNHIALRITPSEQDYHWEAGQWIDFAVPAHPHFSMAGYSICSPQGKGSFWLLVRKSKHPITNWIFSSAKIGGTVLIGPASGSCIYKPEEHHNMVCFAGGVGITPMISMIRTARRLGKQATLYYAIKSIEDNPYPDELTQEELFIEPNKLSFSELSKRHTQDTHFFLCGPRLFIDDGVQTLQKHRFPHIHFERWW